MGTSEEEIAAARAYFGNFPGDPRSVKFKTGTLEPLDAEGPPQWWRRAWHRISLWLWPPDLRKPGC
jgi:hypothetical protein